MRTVMIVEDDSDFREVLCEIFEAAPNFTVLQVFSSLETFGDYLPNEVADAQNVIADLVCMDVFSSAERVYGSTKQNGATVAFYLRRAGLKFATLLLSSEGLFNPSQSARVKMPSGIVTLIKSSALTSADVIRHAEQALAGLEEKS